VTQLDLFPPLPQVLIIDEQKPGERECANCYELMTPRRRCCSWFCSRCFIELEDLAEGVRHGR
jgi:hypothetical protein